VRSDGGEAGEGLPDCSGAEEEGGLLWEAGQFEEGQGVGETGMVSRFILLLLRLSPFVPVPTSVRSPKIGLAASPHRQAK
jgi:hypothetical protein